MELIRDATLRSSHSRYSTTDKAQPTTVTSADMRVQSQELATSIDLRHAPRLPHWPSVVRALGLELRCLLMPYNSC